MEILWDTEAAMVKQNPSDASEANIGITVLPIPSAVESKVQSYTSGKVGFRLLTAATERPGGGASLSGQRRALKLYESRKQSDDWGVSFAVPQIPLSLLYCMSAISF